MSEGQSVADLMLRMGVDVGEMISGFNSAGRISRQMAKDMAEGMNASLQKAFDPSAINSGRMFENLETQYRATVSTMLRESIQARAVIERSAENVKRFALEAAEADRKVMGELLTEQANFYNVKQGLRTAELANIQATANQEVEIQQRSLDMQAALRKRYAAEIAAFEAETAADKQQRMINEANQRDALQFHMRRSASLENMKSIADAETEILARSTALREDILERYRLKRQEDTEKEIAAEARANETRIAMLRESIEARAILERSVANINQAASESMIAGMAKVGGTKFDPMISMLNAAATKQKQQAAEQAEQAVEDELLRRQDLINSYNREQRELRETADAVRRNQENYDGLVQQMQQAEIQGRRLARARSLDAKLAEEAARSDEREARAREALAASLADGEERQNRRREVAARLQAKLDADSQRIKEAGAKQAVEAAETEARINRQVAAEATAVSQADRRAQEMLTEQMERGNEALQFRNRLRREARAFASQLEEAGITPGSARYNQMTQAFRQEQQRQRDEFANRDRRAAATRRQNELDQQAARIIRSVMSAEAAHAQRLRELEELYQTNRLSLDQYNAAMRQSEQIMRSQRAGSGGATGVLAQLSFGIEDFAQGLAMGDLRAAMLGASNNITMVVRGLRDMTSETRTATFAAMRLPLALAGLAGAGAAALGLYHHLVNMNTEMKSLTDRISEATRQYFKFNQADELASRQEQRAEELKAVDTLEGIEVKRRQAELAHADLMRKLETERNENNVRGREAIMKMLGGEANFIELQQYLQEKGTQESQIALDQLSRAQAAALKGNTEVAFNEMKMLFEFLDRESTKGSLALFRALAEGSPGTVKELTLFDLPALNELQKYFKQGGLSTLSMWGDSEEALAEIRTVLDGIAKDESKAAAQRKDAAKAMEEIDRRTAELAAQRKMDEEHLAKLEADKLEMRQQAAKFDAETVRLRQQEELFLIKATDQEKELYRLRKEQQGFVRPQAAVVGLDPILNALMAQGMADTQQADQIAFLEAQKQAAQNEMNALMQQAIPKAQGALEQNAFQAQADAFKQMTENMAQKPNPQLTQVVNRLKAIEDAIKAGGAFIQVGP